MLARHGNRRKANMFQQINTGFTLEEMKEKKENKIKVTVSMPEINYAASSQTGHPVIIIYFNLQFWRIQRFKIKTDMT